MADQKSRIPSPIPANMWQPPPHDTTPIHGHPKLQVFLGAAVPNLDQLPWYEQHWMCSSKPPGLEILPQWPLFLKVNCPQNKAVETIKCFKRRGHIWVLGKYCKPLRNWVDDHPILYGNTGSWSTPDMNSPKWRDNPSLSYLLRLNLRNHPPPNTPLTLKKIQHEKDQQLLVNQRIHVFMDQSIYVYKYTCIYIYLYTSISTLRTNYQPSVDFCNQPPALLLYWETSDLRGQAESGSGRNICRYCRDSWPFGPWCILKFHSSSSRLVCVQTDPSLPAKWWNRP